MNPVNQPGAGGIRGAGLCDVEAVNALLRGEISAVQTYDQAIRKFDDHPAGRALWGVREEHSRAVSALRDRVRGFGGEPADSSGTWGAFATAVTGAAKVIGPQTVLAALKQGEEQGTQEYIEALDNPEIADECRFLIRAELLPKCHAHVAVLERLITRLEMA
jgi:hypothetical protein